VTCPSCGLVVAADAAQCPRCGSSLELGVSDGPDRYDEDYEYGYDPPAPARDLRGAGLAAVVAVGAFTAVKGVDSVLSLTSGADREIQPGSAVRGTMLASLVLALVMGLALLVWLYRARTNLDAFADAAPRWSVGWTLGALFIPCANIVLVPVVLADLARWSVRDGSVARARRVIALIWFCLALYVLASFSSGLFSAFAETSGPSAGAVTAGLVLGVAAGVMLMLVIHSITAEQQARIAAASIPSYGETR
jgi:hypothetical protein